METINLGERALHRGEDARWRCSELFVLLLLSTVHSRLPASVLAWDYRRYVIASMPVRRSEKTELAYTTKKIEANFSNFSAWHQRTKVLSSLWASGEVDKASSLQRGANGSSKLYRLCQTKLAQSEFELVQNAMFTLPEDQSAWLYHRWLIGSGRQFVPRFTTRRP
jgi:geranylgeranyl transferase type-2 subunit alpha